MWNCMGEETLNGVKSSVVVENVIIEVYWLKGADHCWLNINILFTLCRILSCFFVLYVITEKNV